MENPSGMSYHEVDDLLRDHLGTAAGSEEPVNLNHDLSALSKYSLSTRPKKIEPLKSLQTIRKDDSKYEEK